MEDWEYEEKKRSVSMMFGIPMAVCIIAAVVAIGAAIYIGTMNYVIIGIIGVCIVAAFILAFLLFSGRSKYNRLQHMGR